MSATNRKTKLCLVLVLFLSTSPALSAFNVVSFPRQRNQATTRLASVPNALDVFSSGMASVCRLPHGVTAIEGGSNPESNTQLTLYDVENDVNCRIVRERLTELDLNVKVVPSAPNSQVFTNPAYKYALPSGTTIPTLQIGNNNKMLSGSEEILKYLNEAYGRSGAQKGAGGDEDAIEQLKGSLAVVTNAVASLLRFGRGCQVSPAASDTTGSAESPLILYSYEGNQFCRLVREVMTELDIVYELKSTGKGSSRRTSLAQLTGGSTQCPYLVDPNRGESMPESADIIKYLYANYGKYTPPNELLQFVGEKVLPIFRPAFATQTKLQAGEKSPNNNTRAEIESEVVSAPVVIYTYSLSPFSSETKTLLDRLNVEYKEISLGMEWFPGFINQGGAQKRAALLSMTGQSSLPHIFIGGKWIGGLFDGEPGLVPTLKIGSFWSLVQDANSLQNHFGSFE